MDEKTLFHNRYYLERLLGRGAYSEVWLARDEKIGGTEVALKIYAPSTGLDDNDMDMFAHEFSLVLGISDANILKPLYYDSFDRKPYLVLPYCKKGSLKKKIGNMSEQEAWSAISDVAKGLYALHTMEPPIVHQDIKPDNIMISDSGHHMITDFGVSKHLHRTLKKSVGDNYNTDGTRAYMAPERYSRHNSPIMASDVWSLGATIYELLDGEPPFGEEGGLLQKSGADIPELEGEWSSVLKETIERCLTFNPWERPTTEELIELSDRELALISNHFARSTTPFPQYDENQEEKSSPKLIYIATAVIGITIGIIIALIA